MKKYFILGIIVIALVAIWLILPSAQMGPRGAGPPAVAFYGTATTGFTVTACGYPQHFPCFEDIAEFNYYLIYIPQGNEGYYEIGDGCQTKYAGWDGDNPQKVDFCVNYPGQPECPCY